MMRLSVLVASLCAGPVWAQSPLVVGQPDPAGPVAAYYRDPAAAPLLSDAQMAALVRAKVRYVFVLFQENRSFDHYYGTFPGANGLFADGMTPRSADLTPGFREPVLDTDGTPITISPFRVGPEQHAADLDDVDHGHVRMADKMHLLGGVPAMDRFAMQEELKYVPKGAKLPPLKAKQFGELAMAYVDCDTVPLMWSYANRFALFDNIFQTTIGPSTPNAIAMIAGQVGETQWVKHPDKIATQYGPAVPVIADPIPYWGSPQDKSDHPLPANPARERGTPENVAPNLTFASLPLTLAGKALPERVATDADPSRNLADIQQDIPAIAKGGRDAVSWGWYEEGYDREPNEPADAPGGGSHASYIGHHNGPQYFGYIADNPAMSDKLHGLGDFYADIQASRLPAGGGVFYVRGGYKDISGLKPAFDDGSAEAAMVQKNFAGDDDHPGYSDSELSEALVARSVNAIARSKYWDQSAIIVTYDESEGDYDHVPPRILSFDPSGIPLSRGPRIPLLLISPYARAHVVSHEEGDHNAVIALINNVFSLPALAGLPDELEARIAGTDAKFNGPGGFVQNYLGPHDDLTPGSGSLLSGFDPARLRGDAPPLPAAYAEIPDEIVRRLPHYDGKGCSALGITPMDRRLGIQTVIPADFNPRPSSYPTK